MSTTKTEMKYVEKLNIGTLGIGGIKKLIKNYFISCLIAMQKNIKIEKHTFHIIGPAGVGKTQICDQIAKEISEELKIQMKTITIKAPVLSRDDMIIPFPVIEGENKSFVMLYSDFIPKDPNSFGIFVIDERSRGDHSFQQLMWQVENEHKLHLHPFPKGWFVISIDNPDDAEYSMDMLEDAAGIRRTIHVFTEVSVRDFLIYGKSMGFHQLVIDFIEAKPDNLYDFASQKKGMVYANPASWEKLSTQLQLFDMTDGWRSHLDELDITSSGLINASMTRLFLEFSKDQKDVTPKDVFYKYNDPEIRKVVLDFIKNNKNTKLAELMKGFFVWITSNKPAYEKIEMTNVINFLTDIPIDTAAIWVTDLDSMDRTTEEYLYMTKLHMAAVKEEKYRKDFYQRLSTLNEKKKETNGSK